jgi:hypothetical protein
MNLLENTFIWCFYQTLFQKNRDSKNIFSSIESQKLESDNETITNSYLEKAIKNQKIHFTFCGQNKQASDIAILKIIEILIDVYSLFKYLEISHGFGFFRQRFTCRSFG